MGFSTVKGGIISNDTLNQSPHFISLVSIQGDFESSHGTFQEASLLANFLIIE